MGFKELGERLKQRWDGLSLRLKLIAFGAGIVFVISLAFLTGSSRMVPLYSDLDAKDAAAVVEQLKKANVKYRLADKGSTILVSENELYDLRLQMASSGAAPESGSGFELFDETKLGVTDFERRLNYQRALQEELRRTIVQLDEVDQVRVHLVLPEKSVFVEEDTSASASVALKLKPGRKLGSEQVRGIVLLVAGSVEGLKPENITVINMEGQVLSDGAGEGSSGVITGQSQKNNQLKEAFEEQTEARIREMLDKIFGPGKAVAVVSADLDFSQHERHSVTYGKQSVRSETGMSRESDNILAGAGGAAGAESNIPDYDALDSEIEEDITGTLPGEGEEYTRNYELDTTEERIVFAPGEIKKLSVAVVVDGTLTEEKTDEVQSLVIAAAGLVPERGDQITVSSMAFDSSLKEELDQDFEEAGTLEKEAAKKAAIKKWTILGIGAFLLVAAIIILVLILKKKSRPLLNVPVQEPETISKISEEAVATSEVLVRKEQQTKVKKYMEELPEEAANILKTWLTYEE